MTPSSRRVFVLSVLLLAGGSGCSDPVATQIPNPNRANTPGQTPGAMKTPGAATTAGAPTALVTISPAQTTTAPNMSATLVAKADTSDPDKDGVSVDWKWFVNGIELPDVLGDTLAPGRFKSGDKIEVEGTPRDTKGTRGSPARTGTLIRNTKPLIASTPGASLDGYKVAVTDPDAGEKYTYELEAPIPAGFTITPEGVVKQDPKAAKPKTGEKLTVVVKDSAGAVDKQVIEFK